MFALPGLWGFCRVVRMVRLLRFAAVVTLGGIASAGLSACSDAGANGEVASPSASVVTSPTPSVTPSPSETPEEELLERIPEEARYESFPSAVKFSQFFLELYMPMFAPPYDTELFEFLCTDESAYCASSIANAKATRDAGAYSEGGEYSWTPKFARGGLESDGYWYVTQPFSITDSTTYGPDGSILKSRGGATGEVGLKLTFDSGTWRVVGVEYAVDGE